MARIELKDVRKVFHAGKPNEFCALDGITAASEPGMVANLTVGKKGYEEAWAELAAMAERDQALKDRLARAVDEDADAFNRVMEAVRMPKGTRTAGGAKPGRRGGE